MLNKFMVVVTLTVARRKTEDIIGSVQKPFIIVYWRFLTGRSRTTLVFLHYEAVCLWIYPFCFLADFGSCQIIQLLVQHHAVSWRYRRESFCRGKKKPTVRGNNVELCCRTSASQLGQPLYRKTRVKFPFVLPLDCEWYEVSCRRSQYGIVMVLLQQRAW